MAAREIPEKSKDVYAYSYQYTAAVGEAGVERVILDNCTGGKPLRRIMQSCLALREIQATEILSYNYSICDARLYQKNRSD